MEEHGNSQGNDAGGQAQSSPPKHGSQNPLSCTNCRQRKVKCNRVSPCSPCQRSSLDCVFPERVRHPKKKKNASKASNEELLARLSRMEQLIGKIEGDGKDSVTNSVDTASPSARDTDSMDRRQSHDTFQLKREPSDAPGDDRLNRYMGSSFWRSLTSEVEGLRQTVDEDEDEEENSTTSPPSNPGSYVSHSSIMFGSTLSSPKDLRLFHPSLAQVSMLCTIYITNVDPVFKVLHVPSLQNLVTDAIANFENIPSDNYVEAMLFAMYYAAVTSLTPDQCLQQFKDGRDSLLARYRAGTERALSNADFLNTEELGILQALAMFLIAVRSNDKTQFSWSLTGTLIRLAQAMGIHRESAGSNMSPFEQEMRRRLWWQLISLDVRCTEDRGTDPAISEAMFNTKKPANINDSDMAPNMTQPIVGRTGHTEMSKCRVSHEVSFIAGKFNYHQPLKEGQETPPPMAFEEKLDLLRTVEKRIENEILAYCDPSNPIAWVTSVVARLIFCRIRLAMYHPPQHGDRGFSASTVSREERLRNAVQTLEYGHLLKTEKAAARFRFFTDTYVQWHALAATLAELCIQTRGPGVERAWRIVDLTFDEWAANVADSANGRLWTPMKKLKNKADARRRQQDMTNTGSTLQRQMPLPQFEAIASDPMSVDMQAMESTPFSILDERLVAQEAAPSDVFASLNVDESLEPINWTEWDELMADFEMVDQRGIVEVQPENSQPTT